MGLDEKLRSIIGSVVLSLGSLVGIYGFTGAVSCMQEHNNYCKSGSLLSDIDTEIHNKHKSASRDYLPYALFGGLATASSLSILPRKR